ncbi:MAG: PilN domain-containing protein [Phycisphaerales bacterium]
MHQIDLMPQKCREVLGRRIWLRRWAGGYAATIAVLALAVWFAGATEQSKRNKRDQLDAVRTIRWEQNEEAQTLQKEIEQLERRIERHNTLAWPVRVSEVMDTIANVVPEGVSLLTFTVTQREEVVEVKAQKERGKAHDERRSILIIEIEGVSKNDGLVATMVSGLQSVPVFRSVVLDYARNINVDTVPARSFSISCEIDLSVSYRFVAGVEASDGTF